MSIKDKYSPQLRKVTDTARTITVKGFLKVVLAYSPALIKELQKQVDSEQAKGKKTGHRDLLPFIHPDA